MPFDSVKTKLVEQTKTMNSIIFNKTEIDNEIDPKLKALAKALIKKGILTKQEILNEL